MFYFFLWFRPIAMQFDLLVQHWSMIKLPNAHFQAVLRIVDRIFHQKFSIKIESQRIKIIFKDIVGVVTKKIPLISLL